jgi:pimeloyl-ACP methyl ester carboxylesterase
MKATTPAAKRPLWRRKFIVGASVFVALLTGVSVLIVAELPSLAAGGLLHPRRRHVAVAAPANCDNATFAGAGVRLEGWRCRATGARRGTVVYLHGIADNRASAVGAIDTFSRQGFDVVAYDSRGHGESTGDICTYGHFEQRDLRRVLDTVAAGPIVLVGTSLGAAVAIQEAADNPA